MSKNIELLAKWIAESKYLIVFTGAGVSTASGIPDYRGPEGVWTLRDRGEKPKPLSKPISEFPPNAAHMTIVELQNMGIMKYLISQNVDGLHIKSGIKLDMIAELHGNSNFYKCMSCDARFKKEEIGWNTALYGPGYRTRKPVQGQPDCPECGGRIISSIINFEDPMPAREMRDSEYHSKKADLYLVVGSSLMVQPAASFPVDAVNNGAKLVIINQGETGLDLMADMKMEDDCSVILPKVLERVKELRS